MSDPIIRACDHYVVLEPGQTEKILSAQETLSWLEKWLKKLDRLPEDLKNYPTLSSAAYRLLETACNLEIANGFTLQWYAVRLSPEER